MIKNFLLQNAELPTAFFAQNSLRFGRQAPQTGRGEFDYSSLAAYTENSSDAFRRLRRRGRQAPQNLI